MTGGLAIRFLLAGFLVLSPAAPALADGLLGTLGRKLFGQNQPRFLPPGEAFVLSAEVAGPDVVELRWHIADDYYLYRDRFQFRLSHGGDATLGEPVLPPPAEVREDEFFGRMAVYYEDVVVRLPVDRERTADRPVSMTVEATWQGCAAAGFCYPPMSATLVLDLPAS